MLCSICGTNSIGKISTIDGYRQTTSYAVGECGSCGTSSVRPCEIDVRLYEEIYKQVQNVPGYSRYYSLANDIARQADPLDYIANLEEPYFAITDLLRNQSTQSDHLQICEVGCGQGYFTFALRNAGFNVTGVDHSTKAIELARKRYGDFYFCGDLTDYVAGLREPPQVIFACELIEHLVDPVSFVSTALECLPSGGLLAVTTPNKLQYAGESSHGLIWDTDPPPVHLWWFTKNSFVEIAKQLNCSVSFSDFTKFYRTNERYLLPEEGTPTSRSPIMDEDYRLIQFSKRDGAAWIKKALKEVLPKSAVQALQRRRASRGGDLRYRDDLTAATIGALFRKK